MSRLLKQLIETPKKLFLIDGIGALITAFSLTLMSFFEESIGLSHVILNNLAAAAIVFSVYSITCAFRVKRSAEIFLRIIAIANLLYCYTTGYLIFNHFTSLTILGVVYFFGEIIIVCVVAGVELYVSYKYKLLNNKKI